MSELVTMDIDGRVCTLCLNRPESLNALNHALFAELQGHLVKIEQKPVDIACVILKGNGRAFSAGHDLKDIAGGKVNEDEDFEATILENLASLPQPTIAQIHGFCFTGALELALACDLIFCDEDAKLSDTHSAWGLSPIWGMTQRLPRRVGVSRAKEMMFSGRRLGAEESLSIGLVDKVFPTDELTVETQAYASQVTDNSPYSNSVIKRVLSATDGLRLHDGLDYEYSNSPGACEDMQERVDSFMARSKA
jgi:enoyl-CoA hydratase